MKGIRKIDRIRRNEWYKSMKTKVFCVSSVWEKKIMMIVYISFKIFIYQINPRDKLGDPRRKVDHNVDSGFMRNLI
jgi:hypothetical protein